MHGQPPVPVLQDSQSCWHGQHAGMGTGDRHRRAPRTQPDTAVELHAQAHVHGVVSDRDEADKAGDEGRLQVLEDDVIGVGVSIQHLEREKHGGDGQEEPPHPPLNAAPTQSLLTCFPCRFLQEIQRVPSRL